MRRMDVSIAARRDVLAIADYLGERSEDARRRFFDETDACLRTLDVVPFIGRVVKPARGRGTALRSYRVSGRFWQYLVFYRVFTNSIRIVRIVHGAQDTRTILRLAE